MSLRQHVKALHPKIKPARSNADLEKQHAKEHHQYFSGHDHVDPVVGSHGNPGKMGSNKSERPRGWKTGEDTIMKKRK